METIALPMSAKQSYANRPFFRGFSSSTFAALHPNLVEALIFSAPGTIEPLHFDADGNYLNYAKYPIPESLDFIEVAHTYREDTAASNLPVRAIVSLTPRSIVRHQICVRPRVG